MRSLDGEALSESVFERGETAVTVSLSTPRPGRDDQVLRRTAEDGDGRGRVRSRVNGDSAVRAEPLQPGREPAEVRPTWPPA